MRIQRIRATFKKLVEKNLLDKRNRGNITTFFEQPSDRHNPETAVTPEKICAHELFSRFTADIISERQVFVR